MSPLNSISIVVHCKEDYDATATFSVGNRGHVHMLNSGTDDMIISSDTLRAVADMLDVVLSFQGETA